MGRQDLVIFAVRLKSNVAEKKNMHLNTCITKGSREYPEYMTVTAASLSQLALTVVPFHCLPQRAAIAIGLVLWLQFALVERHMATETESNLNSRRYLHPMNLRHRSATHGLDDLRLDIAGWRCRSKIQWTCAAICGLTVNPTDVSMFAFCFCEKGDSLPMNNLPGLTTLQASLRWPRSDLGFFLEHTFFNCHSDKSFLSLLSFSCGSLSSMAIVLISIPRKTRKVEGAMHLWVASGTPNFVQVSYLIRWLSVHWLVPGGPKVMKSSRWWAMKDVPGCCRTHCSPSARAVNTRGALQRLKGSAATTYTWPSQ